MVGQPCHALPLHHVKGMQPQQATWPLFTLPTVSQPPAALAMYLLSQVLQLQPSVFLSLQPVPLTEHCTVTRRRAVTLAISKLEKQLQHTSE